MLLDRGGAKSYYYSDGLGSIREMADSGGTVQNSSAYGAWGEVRAQSVAIPNIYGYTGREFAEEGLYYYRARYMDPRLGRFVSEDIMAIEERMNLYTYTKNSPINYIDPSGYLSYQNGVRPPNPTVENMLRCMENFLGGADFSIGSGTRTRPNTPEAKEDQERGHESAHYSGEAADISGKYSNFNGKTFCDVKRAAIECGFKRACQHKTGLHIHVDTNPYNQPQDCKKWEKGNYKDPCNPCDNIW